MAFDLIPSRMWSRFPIMWDDDDMNGIPQMHNSISISEDEGHVYVSVNVPGVNPDDISITFDKGILLVSAQAKEEESDKKRKFYRKAVNSFSYRIAVPGEIDNNAEPEATYKHGVMTIAFAKIPQSQPKKIAVKHA
jgi:HSP20 family protein